MLSAQSEAQVQTHLAAAETANSGGDLEEARFQLQQALVELDKVVGKNLGSTATFNQRPESRY